MKSGLRAVILGGGVSGLSAAWRLGQQGAGSLIIESAPTVGGLAGTVRQGPYFLDYGPHSFFSDDDGIRETVTGLFENTLPEIPRSVKLYYHGKYLNYPFAPADLLFNMGIRTALRTFASYLASRFQRNHDSREDEESVAQWAVRTFGEKLYQDFFKPYTEQFWKIPCEELSARTIPSHTRVSFTETLKSLFKKKNNGGSLLDREKLPTYYPATGYGEIADKMAAKVRENGCEILCSARVVHVARQGNQWKVIYLSSGEEKEVTAPRVISTLPISSLVPMLSPEAPAAVKDSAKALEFRPIVVLGLITQKQNILNCAYMYTLNRPYNRLTETNRFSPGTSPDGENILALEIPCTKDDVAWYASQEELFERCMPSLEKDGILKREEVRGLMLVKAPHAYPIYRKGYQKHLRVVTDYLNGLKGFYSLGRGGEFMYMDADRCIRRGFDLADRIIKEEGAAIASS